MYPFIENNQIVGFSESISKAEELAGGFTVVFVNEYHSIHDKIGFFVKSDGADFDKTKLAASLNDIVKKHSPFNDLTTRNSGETDFCEMSVWSLKELLIDTLNKTNNF